MPENKDYISNVYQAIKDNVDGFDKDEATFRSEMEKPEYVTKVHAALKDNLDGFDKTIEQFSESVKKKGETITTTTQESVKTTVQAPPNPLEAFSKTFGSVPLIGPIIQEKLQSASSTSAPETTKSVSTEKSAKSVTKGYAQQAAGEASKEANRPKTNFENRIKNPVLTIKNEDGSVSTHKMMSFEADGKFYAAPTIIEREGKLEELSQEDAIDYAFKNNEYKEFKTENEAQEYARGGYKKGTPLAATQQAGGAAIVSPSGGSEYVNSHDGISGPLPIRQVSKEYEQQLRKKKEEALLYAEELSKKSSEAAGRINKGIEDYKYANDRAETAHAFAQGNQNDPYAKTAADGAAIALQETIKKNEPELKYYENINSQLAKNEEKLDALKDEMKSLGVEDEETSMVGGVVKSFLMGTAEVTKAIAGATSMVGDLTGNQGAYVSGFLLDKGATALEEDWKESPNAPNTFMGNVLSGLAGMAPSLMLAETMPLVGLGSRIEAATGGLIKTVPKFAISSGIEGMGKAYSEDKNVVDAAKGLAEGVATGTYMHALGYPIGPATSLAKKLGAGKLTQAATGAITGGTIFGTETLVRGGTAEEAEVAFGTGVAFGAREIGKALHESATETFFVTPTETIKEANAVEASVEDLRMQAESLFEKYKSEKNKEKKVQYYLALKSIIKIADIKAITDDVVANPSKRIEEIKNDPDISEEGKAFLIDHVNKVVAENDPKVIAARPINDKITTLKSEIGIITDNQYLPQLDKDQQIAAKEKEIKELENQVSLIYSQKQITDGKESQSKSSGKEITQEEGGIREGKEVLSTEGSPLTRETAKVGELYISKDKAGNEYYWEKGETKDISITKAEYERKRDKVTSKKVNAPDIAIGEVVEIDGKKYTKIETAIVGEEKGTAYKDESGITYKSEWVEDKLPKPTEATPTKAGSVGVVSIFHGTTKEIAKQIEDNGFDVEKGADGTMWFTSDKSRIEKGDVGASVNGGIVERTIDESNLKLGGYEEQDKYSTGELINKGYDGLKLVDEDGQITYQI